MASTTRLENARRMAMSSSVYRQCRGRERRRKIRIRDVWPAPFTRCIKELLSDDDYADLQAMLVERPEAGDLIQGSHGLRKLRWKIEGSGKRGGVRVIYYWLTADEQLWMLYAYAKAERQDLTRQQLKQLAEIVKRWKDG